MTRRIGAVPSRGVRPFRPLLAAPLVLVALLAGCGGSDEPSFGADDLATLATTPSSFSGARFDVAVQETAPGKRPVEADATGIVDEAGTHALLDIDLRGLPPAKVGLKRAAVSAIADGLVLYLPPAAVAGGTLPPGVKWVRLDPRNLDGAPDTDSVDAVVQDVPFRPLAYLGGSTGKLEKLGVESFNDGVATHYRVHVDFARALARLPKGDSAERKVFERLVRTAPGGAAFDVWVDQDNRIVEAAGIYTRQTPAGPRRVKTVMQVNSWQLESAVVPPPARHTADLAAVLGSSG